MKLTEVKTEDQFYFQVWNQYDDDKLMINLNDKLMTQFECNSLVWDQIRKQVHKFNKQVYVQFRDQINQEVTNETN